MNHDYFHIKKVHINAHKMHGKNNHYTLTIETELPLPQFGTDNPQMDTLLNEIADLKEKNPKLFADVDDVEIRHMPATSQNELDRLSSDIDNLSDSALLWHAEIYNREPRRAYR